jgi:hypothetical protein
MANKDIAILAQKVYELSILPVAELDARKVEAFLIVSNVYSSATKEGVAKANADKVARFGAQIEKEGLLAALHPKWHLRTDDGKPPAAMWALESALDNPHRSLRDRLATLLLIPPDDRPTLRDLALALEVDAWHGATGDARIEFGNVMGSISKTWTKDPWLTILQHGDQPPPVLILIDNQGETNDGGVFDNDPSDDPYWATAIRTWDVDFLRDNPLAQFYLKAEAVAETAANTATVAAGTAAEVAKAANSLALGLAKFIKYAPYAAAVVVATVIVVATRDKAPPATAAVP